jgi:hypothetical protein
MVYDRISTHQAHRFPTEQSRLCLACGTQTKLQDNGLHVLNIQTFNLLQVATHRHLGMHYTYHRLALHQDLVNAPEGVHGAG